MSIQQLFLTGKTSVMTATGGTITYDGDFAVHTFASSGTFTVTYKRTTGLAFEMLLASGSAGGAGGDITGGDTSGANGGGGGNSYYRYLTALSVDSLLGSGCPVTPSTPAYNSSDFYATSAAVNYRSIDGTYIPGGAGGSASMNGSPGTNGTSNSITGSAVVYGGGGAGGGGGGDFSNPAGGAGGESTNGGGNGGAGGNADDPVGDLNGSPGSAATSGYGRGGGGGGGAATNESNDYFGGAGGAGTNGVVIVRYRYQQ